jgi:riboflavin biosynthesis pyrimidine reductase
VLSASLELPLGPLEAARRQRRVLVLTIPGASPARRRELAAVGCEVLDAGESQVLAPPALAALAERGLGYVYAISGPDVLRTLVAAERLNRLYLTTVFRLLGGDRIATLLRDGPVQPPIGFRLREAYLDQAPGLSEPPQLIQVFDVSRVV